MVHPSPRELWAGGFVKTPSSPKHGHRPGPAVPPPVGRVRTDPTRSPAATLPAAPGPARPLLCPPGAAVAPAEALGAAAAGLKGGRGSRRRPGGACRGFQRGNCAWGGNLCLGRAGGKMSARSAGGRAGCAVRGKGQGRARWVRAGERGKPSWRVASRRLLVAVGEWEAGEKRELHVSYKRKQNRTTKPKQTNKNPKTHPKTKMMLLWLNRELEMQGLKYLRKQVLLRAGG